MIDAWGRETRKGPATEGVYWQTDGPRFETPAEIRMIAAFADVVGMTIASECIVAGELDLAYAAICVIDNLANGLRSDPLSVAEFEDGKAANRADTAATVTRVATALAREGPAAARVRG